MNLDTAQESSPHLFSYHIRSISSDGFYYNFCDCLNNWNKKIIIKIDVRIISLRKTVPVLFLLRNAAWGAPLAANHTTAGHPTDGVIINTSVL